MNQLTRILQLTDLHLFGNQQTALIGINPFQTLQQILANISNDIIYNLPDLIVLTGDISQDYSLSSYKTVAQIFQNFPCPVVVTMGNHDYPLLFIQTFGKPTQLASKIVTTTNWCILILNSNWPKHVDGQLTKTDLVFLEKNLTANQHQPTIIFLHHHVLSVGSDWLDKIKLQNSSQFLAIIDQFKNIKAVVCGHVHQDTSILRHEVMFLSTPATSWQFAPGRHEFRLDKLMPGYRWINLYEDGTIQTKVTRIKYSDEFVPDTTSKGY